MINVRKTTNKVCELAEEGIISWRDLAMMSLKWMSEDDVAAMCKANEVFIENDDEDD